MDDVAVSNATDEAPTLYERDFHEWCFEQAEFLRLRRFDQSDLPNIIEELRDLGGALRSSLRSSYRLVIAHLLKWEHQPNKRSVSWQVTLVRERGNIEDIERSNRSLKNDAALLVREAYRRARKEAQVETGLPLSTFPTECPYTLDQLRDDEWMPD